MADTGAFKIFLYIIISLYLTGHHSDVQAQSYQQHSLYMLDLYNSNPAYAGFDRSLSANFNFRNQWNAIEGAPQQIYLNAHMPIYLLNGGMGIRLYNDQRGILGNTGVDVSYNRVTSFQWGIISLGARIGMRQLTINGNDIRTPQGIYQGIFSHEDPLLSEADLNGMHPHYNLGFYLASDYFDFGMHLNDIFTAEENVSDGIYTNQQSLGIYAAIPFYISNLEMQVSSYIKSNFSLTQTDISLMAKNGNIFGGLSLRGFNENSFDSMVIFGGLKLNKHYTVSYAYDYGINALADFSQGTHEIMLNYNLAKLIGIGLPPEIIYNPRNL